MIKIVSIDNLDLNQSVASRMSRILWALQNSGKPIQDALVYGTRNHFQTIYPGSNHYNPNKVQPESTKQSYSAVTATAIVDVPGVTRAYHDITIFPRIRKTLTIPIHRSAYGKKASSFDNTFIVKKKNGKAFIAQNNGGNLVFLYVLARRAFQPKDNGLMPSDESFAINIANRIRVYLDREWKK